MDRETLVYLLRSGKYLCYNPVAYLEFEALAAEQQRSDSLGGTTLPKPVSRDSAQSDGESDHSQQPGLFDSPYLGSAVFFKEAQVDEDGDFSASTRVLLPFNSDNTHEGGASTLADPDHFEKAMNKWLGGKVKVRLSPHDQNVLSVLNRIPTFDPFLMAARRSEVEQDRAVPSVYFDIESQTAEEVLGIITDRARALVTIALSDGVSQRRVDATIDAVKKSVWECKANQRTGRLFLSLGIPQDQIERILFAWKGIAYYEFLFRDFGKDFAHLLGWLGTAESQPNDAEMIDMQRLERVRRKRGMAQKVMRRYYAHATEILKRHQESYDALVKRGRPELFQKFLLAAPNLFETLGLSIGSFGHANNAWKTLTNNGRRPRRKAETLEPFFDFLGNLASGRTD